MFSRGFIQLKSRTLSCAIGTAFRYNLHNKLFYILYYCSAVLYFFLIAKYFFLVKNSAVKPNAETSINVINSGVFELSPVCGFV